MKVLTGRNAKAYLRFDDDQFKPIFCGISISLSVEFEDVRVTTRTSGKWRRRKSGLGDAGVTVTGLTKVDNSDGQVSWFYLNQAGVAGARVFIKIEYTDDDGNSQTVSGWVIVSRLNLDSGIPGFTTASVYLPFDGGYEMGAVEGLVPTDVFKLYLSTTEGAHTVSHADLGDIEEVLLVLREGRGYKEVTGTPIGAQFKFTDNTIDGIVAFDSSLPFNAGEVVYVEYKKSV
jgi:hypothetical protein